MSTRVRPWPQLQLSRPTALTLAVVAIGGLWSWFLLKFRLPSASGALEVAVGALAFAATVSGVTLMLSSYAHRAIGDCPRIDERELAERNRAHVVTLSYVAACLTLGFVALESGVAGSASVPVGVVGNYLAMCVFTLLLFPPALLAWWDVGEQGEE